MNFVFENLPALENFCSCPDVNPSSIRRFAPAPMAVTLLHRTQMAKEYSILNKVKPYIIATGVNHHPNDWAGSPLSNNNTRKNSLSFLHKKQLRDLQEGKAMILFDQTLEGYQTEWLWQYFHNECDQYHVDPRAVVYSSGNMLGREQYNKWCQDNNIAKQINVIPYTHFESDMKQQAEDMLLNLTVDQHILHKTANADDVRDYNCLQKRLRSHRIWFYIKLFEADILKYGLVSMNKFPAVPTWLDGQSISGKVLEQSNQLLPLLVHGKNNNEHGDNYYIRRIQDKVFLDSWVSVVSEASFADSDQTIFLSEKIFKSIVCQHPFIVMGNKGSLKQLRKMGYKTFDGFIDESYDSLPTFERYDAIIESIKKIIAIEDKAAWYESMRGILIHNYETLQNNAKQINPAFIQLERCYKQYFKLGKYKDAKASNA
jgi:hypothetical protein